MRKSEESFVQARITLGSKPCTKTTFNIRSIWKYIFSSTVSTDSRRYESCKMWSKKSMEIIPFHTCFCIFLFGEPSDKKTNEISKLSASWNGGLGFIYCRMIRMCCPSHKNAYQRAVYIGSLSFHIYK